MLTNFNFHFKHFLGYDGTLKTHKIIYAIIKVYGTK